MNTHVNTRTIAVVSGSRADYGIVQPILRQIDDDPDLALQLIVTGMHLSHEFGHTVDTIEHDGFRIDHRLETLLSSDTPNGTAKSVGLGVLSFSELWTSAAPDVLLLAGDRFEILSAAVASLPFNIPIAHVHGGEVTQGAIDEAIRHSISKMSHLHFTSTRAYAARLVRMGEHPERVHCTGAPGLDALLAARRWTGDEFRARTGTQLAPGTLLVTFHPTTRDPGASIRDFQALLTALEEVRRPLLFTYPNADAGGRKLIEMLEAFARDFPNVEVVRNLGTAGYRTLLETVDAMVGNSSSGIIEAASFELPVVNVGSRQSGRVRAANVIDVEGNSDAITRAILCATSTDFRTGLAGLENPYGVGRAAPQIVGHLKDVSPCPRWLSKGFYDAA